MLLLQPPTISLVAVSQIFSTFTEILTLQTAFFLRIKVLISNCRRLPGYRLMNRGIHTLLFGWMEKQIFSHRLKVQTRMTCWEQSVNGKWFVLYGESLFANKQTPDDKGAKNNRNKAYQGYLDIRVWHANDQAFCKKCDKNKRHFFRQMKVVAQWDHVVNLNCLLLVSWMPFFLRCFIISAIYGETAGFFLIIASESKSGRLF